MAQRYVPAYVRRPAQGWNTPALYGGGVQLDAFRRISLQPPMSPGAPSGVGGQVVANPPDVQQSRAAKVQRSNVHRNEESENLREGITELNYKQFKYTGMFLATLASAAIALGVSNIVVTSVTVMKSQTEVGCFGPDNSQYNVLGPSSQLMWGFDWSWVSSGLWASILIYIAGNLAGTIRRIDSNQTRAFVVVALVSVIIMIPVCLSLSILDSILSEYCSTLDNPTKFGIPVAICVVCGVEFIVISYLLARLWKEARKIQSIDVSEADEGTVGFSGFTSFGSPVLPSPVNPPTPLPSPSIYPLPTAGPSAPGLTPSASTETPPKQPIINIINVQPPMVSQPSPPLQPIIIPIRRRYPPPMIPMRRRYPPPPPHRRWYPRPVGRPMGYSQNHFGVAPRYNPRMFPSHLYPSMVYGGFRRHPF